MTKKSLSAARALAALASLLLITASFASAGEVSNIAVLAGPEPDWITPVSLPAPPAQEIPGEGRGVCYLLDDVQVRVLGRGRDSFCHQAIYIINEGGLEEGGEVSFSYDPAYETPVIHKVSILRDGESLPRLDPAAISVFREEGGLDNRMLDGNMTVQAIVHDLRVGDILEYSYTIRGRDPVFGGIFDSGISLAFSVPLARSYYRLLCPEGRRLFFKSHGTSLKPDYGEAGPYAEYVLDLKDIPAVVEEDDLPEWYDPYPWMQISETGSWGRVAAMCAELYPDPEGLSPELDGLIKRIAEENQAPEDRFMAALKAVRDDVRYLGLEYGSNSYRPHEPSETWGKRFGDCKDKAYLLAVMLRRLGIAAWPALVNADEGKRVASWHPSPHAFDHVIVYARIRGEELWCDPTLTGTAGDFAHRVEPDYGLALLLDPATEDLKEMKPRSLAAPERESALFFDCAVGEGRPVSFTAVTTLRGEAADSFRDRSLRRSREKLEKRYMNYYAEDYPYIERAAPLKIEDDRRTNSIMVTESYRVDKFFSGDGASVYGDEAGSVLYRPRTRIRSMPLALSHPENLRQVITVQLPWRAEPEEEKEEVRDPAFVFTRHVRADGCWFIVTYTLKTLDDHVAPERMAEYLENLGKARGLLYCDVPEQGRRESRWEGYGKDGLLGLIIFCTLLAIFVLAIRRKTDRRLGDRGPIQP